MQTPKNPGLSDAEKEHIRLEEEERVKVRNAAKTKENIFGAKVLGIGCLGLIVVIIVLANIRC